jgi:phage tail P2-like protein
VDLSDISIIKLLPPNLARDENVRMMCEAFDQELRRIIADIPDIAIIPNLVRKQITDNLLLDLLAWQFHCDFYSTDFSIEKKQEIILKSLDWHTRKGTPSVVEEIVSTVFSRAEVQEWFDYGGLPYRFRIGTEEEMPDAETRQNLVRAIKSVKNTRSWLDQIISIIYFEDGFDVTDYLEMIVHVNSFQDYYGQRFKFNGAAKFDGVTQNEYIFVRGKFNGQFKFNGELPFGGNRKFNGDYKFNGAAKFDGVSFGRIRLPEHYHLTPPFKFRSWIVDTLNLSIGGVTHEDTQRAPFWFDGSVKFDGGSKFNGISRHPINSPIAGIRDIKFDGRIKFNGKYQFTNVFGNKIKIGYADNAMSDEMGSSDDVSINIYKYRHFNGAYRFNGAIKFDGIPLVMAG